MIVLLSFAIEILFINKLGKILVLSEIGKLFAKFGIDLFIKICENLRFFQMLKNVKIPLSLFDQHKKYKISF